MPHYSNWKKADDDSRRMTWKYRPDDSVEVVAERDDVAAGHGQGYDRRRRMWFIELVYQGERVGEIYSETTKNDAKKTATSWIAERPDVDSVLDAIEKFVRRSDDVDLDVISVDGRERRLDVDHVAKAETTQTGTLVLSETNGGVDQEFRANSQDVGEFVCSCGRTFDSGKTAAKHLRDESDI